MVERNKRLDDKQKLLTKVENDQGRLRIRWTVEKKRFCLYPRLADTKQNRQIAEAKAYQIHLDIITGNFDPTLKKYKPEQTFAERIDEKVQLQAISLVGMFQRFMEYKARTVDERTIQKYEALLTRIAEFWTDKRADYITQSQGEKFIDHLRKFQKPQTIKDRLSILNACWDWGIKRHYVEYNFWPDIQKTFSAPPKQKPRPFTRDEIDRIIQGFRTDEYYQHYAPYVEFLLLTGVRTAEAIGLRWRHIADDYSNIWIGESITRGKQKSTKTNKDRYFPCNERLKQFLKNHRPTNSLPDDLVFPSPTGRPINDNNFCKRAWTNVLEKAGVPYRKPYNCRHTFISHCLAKGMNPVEVAAVTGHDVQTLYRDYAGLVQSRPKIPEFF